ncbi:YafY family transcriptional regulator [Planotetraspora sp. A-T 1434]|uniref:helix-turn-helix transcriptional regulator n=1 Tax=Planotetraspora sp. A-T 1434 TaxID=2979219 RepID=UPI0021BE6EB2|nr:YafY family protein [Planotetraspora sp. A-T 1434]MCT9930363.1 YafY family transcriptional regulator [Planotetraspora sp. A-T 1434]
MSTNRVLAFLELLQARPGLTGPEIAARLEVDERTVRRYAVRLADLGVPVQAGRGRYGGYRLMPGYRLPPLMLTDDEATAVVLGLLAGRRTGLSVGVTATESALAKIQRVLPEALRDRVRAVEETLDMTSRAPGTAAPRRPSAAALLTLADAARRRRRVRLAYRSFSGSESEREADPYGLVFHSGRWYLTGHDHRSGEVRTFRIDRVSRAEATDVAFSPPGEFDPVRHVMESLAGVPYRHEVEVVLATTMEEARRRIPPSVATLVEVNGPGGENAGVRMTGRADRLDGMARLLAGLGWPFTVIRPDELRGEVRALAQRLMAQA